MPASERGIIGPYDSYSSDRVASVTRRAPSEKEPASAAADAWADDKLNRQRDAQFIIEFLINRSTERKERGLPRSYVLNVNASWGSGKTFFLTRLKQELESKRYIVALVNAWRDDHADDPLLAVMSSIDDALRPYVANDEAQQETLQTVWRVGASVAVAAGKGALIHWAKKGLGEGLDAALSEIGIAGDSAAKTATQDAVAKQLSVIIDERARLLLGEFDKAKQSIESFRRKLSEFLLTIPEERLPLFVLVDELDRCRPSYAISLLERIKHLFDIDNAIFVIATDTHQLQHAVGAVYGSGFDSGRYLNRFFDRSYEFEEPKLRALVAATADWLDDRRIWASPQVKPLDYLTTGAEFFCLTPRDVERVLDLMRTVLTVWNRRFRLQLFFLFPLAVAAQRNMLSNDLNDQLSQNLERSAVRNGSWILNGHDSNGRHSKTTGMEIFKAFVSAANKPVGAFLDQQGARSFPSECAYQAVYEEAQTGSHQQMSFLRQYPALLKTAGRLFAEP